MSSAPDFWAQFADGLRLSASKRSLRAFVPWWLLLCCFTPTLFVYVSKDYLRFYIAETSAVTLLSAIAVVGGFFGSVSIATMGQVQRMASEYPFSKYLRDENLFDHFLFWPQFVLMLQISLILFSTVAATVIRLVDLDIFNRYVIAFDAGLLIYVCTKTWQLIDLVRKLTWHYEEYQRLTEEYKKSQGQNH